VKTTVHFLLLSVSLLVGCVTVQPHFEVYVDSIAAEGVLGGGTFILLPGNKDTSVSDLQFKEFASYAHRALISRGFAPASSFEKADLAIFLAYGIGNPEKHQYTYSLPVWGQTGVSSSSTYGTISTYGSSATYSGTTTYTPSYGITGYTTHTGSLTTYFRFALLSAYDLKTYRATKKEAQVWQTTVTSTGSSNDLRRVFPIMVTATERYLGTNTGQKVKVVLYEDDPAVLETKGIKPEAKEKSK
jgi:hypothetical protein